jgi:uncharacterized protein (DUF885 family)
METKIDYLIEEVKNLKIQIQKLIVQQTCDGDQALITYFQNKSELDFIDKECKESLNDYIKFKDNLSPYLPNVSQNMFNKIVKKMFPTISVGTTTRRGRCVQYFKFK